MAPPDAPYYRSDLARVHHLGFGFHADACAPGILALLEPIRERAVSSSTFSWRSSARRQEPSSLRRKLIPGLLAEHGVNATVQSSFGSETLPAGLRVVVGRRVS